MFTHLCEDGKQTELLDITKPCSNCGEWHPWANDNGIFDDFDDQETLKHESQEYKAYRKGKMVEGGYTKRKTEYPRKTRKRK